MRDVIDILKYKILVYQNSFFDVVNIVDKSILQILQNCQFDTQNWIFSSLLCEDLEFQLFQFSYHL